MIRLLIVDDEPYAVTYLADALMEQEWLDAEIQKAVSGAEALKKLEERQIDILLTDIRMPGISGMELSDHVREKWPRCRTIFLTGYDDFGYAQSALRKGGIDYVLKTEGDEAIFHAIEKALEDIAKELDREEILRRSREQLHLSVPSLRRDYLLQLLQGEVDSCESRKRRFAELDIGLDANGPVLVALGRIDEWGTFVLPGDKSLLLNSIQNIAEEYIRETLHFTAVPYDRGRFVWLVQMKESGRTKEQSRKQFAGSAELIQNAVKSLLKVPVSLVLASDACLWDNVSARVEILKVQLAGVIFNGMEVLMMELPDDTGDERRSSRDYFAENDMRTYLRKLDLLETYLDNGEKEACRSLFGELTTKVSALPEGREGELLKLELIANLSAFFLTYVNKRRLAMIMGPAFRLEEWIHFPVAMDPLSILGRLFTLSESLADFNGQKQAERTSDMIGLIHRYVHEFLHEELSLTKLSELVHLSPTYLSRMYKQTTGQGLLEYVTDVRITRSKQLLKSTSHKIQEISTLVGLDSAAYFTRLFKKETGVTPQEYRESGLN